MNRIVKFILTAIFICLGVFASAQDYIVKSFEMIPDDIDARVNSRVGNNGRKCALLKVYVQDGINHVNGSVVGNIETKGMEKRIYLAHDSKQVELVFENHFPLRIKFDDYNIPVVTEQTVYALKLIEENSDNNRYSVRNNTDQTISKISIDRFPIIYSMRSTIECDGVYKGPDWESKYRNHSKKFHKELSDKFNTKAFFVECSFSCPNAVPVDDYYENLVLLSFDTGGREFSVFLSGANNIVIDTNYGDYTYETKCQYVFNEWNNLQISYNKGRVKIKCNDTLDEFDVVMDEAGWSDNDISTTYWGTMNTFKGYIRDIIVGAAPK